MEYWRDIFFFVVKLLKNFQDSEFQNYISKNIFFLYILLQNFEIPKKELIIFYKNFSKKNNFLDFENFSKIKIFFEYKNNFENFENNEKKILRFKFIKKEIFFMYQKNNQINFSRFIDDMEFLIGNRNEEEDKMFFNLVFK